MAGKSQDWSPAVSAGMKRFTEAHLERLCTDYLALDGWRALKTDPVSRREWGKGFGEKGMADVLYIRYEAIDTPFEGGKCPPDAWSSAEVMWIEWKRKGGKAAAHQQAWHLHERKLGALTLIAGEDFECSFEGFQKWYLASGLRRRV